MTRQRFPNIRILGAVVLCIAVFTVLIALATLTALAQVTGAGQSKRPAVAVPPDGKVSAQAVERPLLLGASNAESVALNPLQTKRHDARVMTPDNSLSFLPPVAYDSGGYTASFVVVGDVNGDGKLDIVLGNECVSSGCSPGGAGVAVLLAKGDGSFQPAVTYGTGGASGPFWPVSIAIADVNGDHKPDLVVANGGSNTVGVLLGNGDGTFQPAVAYGSGAFFPVSVAVADLNGDGKLDIVVANECGPVVCDGSVGVLLGNGDGTFQAVVTHSSGGQYGLSVAVADVNGDGKPDLLVANGCANLNLCGTKGAVAVLLGNGDGTFQAATEYLSGGAYPYSLKIADLNGDGKLDLVAANSFSGTVSVMLGNGDGSFQGAVTYSSGDKAVAQISSVAVADVNGEGHSDLLLTTQSIGANGNNGGAVSVLLGNGDGTFQAAVEYASGGYQTLGVAVGDVNGDGRPDLLIANSCNQNNFGCGGPISTTRGTVTVLLNNTPFCTTPPLITLSASAKSLWPPNGKMVPVTVSGTITDSACTLTGAAYAVTDEYGQVQPSGAVTLGAGGTYSLTVLLQASRLGSDLDGRLYTITVSASNNAGKIGSQTSTVIVPHSQGN